MPPPTPDLSKALARCLIQAGRLSHMWIDGAPRADAARVVRTLRMQGMHRDSVFLSAALAILDLHVGPTGEDMHRLEPVDAHAVIRALAAQGKPKRIAEFLSWVLDAYGLDVDA